MAQACTFSTARNTPIGLPRTVGSLCPECNKVIDATIHEKNGKVVMDKTCLDHGGFHDVIYSDAQLYLKAEKWSFDGWGGVQYPRIRNATRCPQQCGLCDMHMSLACMTNIDLTNRCNLKCPVCFANANEGVGFDLSMEEIAKLLQNIKDANRPQDAHLLQYSGGEPTVHRQFFEAVRLAKDMGFGHVQIATNGIKLCDVEFTRRCKEAGLGAVYLQFDGMTDEVYKRTKGSALLETKKKVVINCREVDLPVALVPTIIKGVNDDQVGPVLEYAIENADIISGISYQPVVFTGRISAEERIRQRYTLSDLAFDVERQTGYAKAMEDWYPLSITSPFIRLGSLITGVNHANIMCHSDCGLGTYLVVNIRDRSIPPVAVTQFIDVENLMLGDFQLIQEALRRKVSRPELFARGLGIVRKSFNQRKAPRGLTFKDILMFPIYRATPRLDKTPWRGLFVAGMHFQDSYNYKTPIDFTQLGKNSYWHNYLILN
jgi:uncharacterized radical SAM superfamily Fe-S cluster-containing enzyme